MEALEQQNRKIVKRKTNHPETRTSCQYCGQSFDEHWKLESHLVEHEEAEQYPCNICNKSFQTSWRLGKHLENHDRKNVKVCKYFKKGHYCPFEKVGCKFSHYTKYEYENQVEMMIHPQMKFSWKTKPTQLTLRKTTKKNLIIVIVKAVVNSLSELNVLNVVASTALNVFKMITQKTCITV